MHALLDVEFEWLVALQEVDQLIVKDMPTVRGWARS
jgi:hypothetical protein